MTETGMMVFRISGEGKTSILVFRGYKVFCRRLAKSLGWDLRQFRGYYTGRFRHWRSDPFAGCVFGVLPLRLIKSPLRWLLHWQYCENGLSAKKCALLAPLLGGICEAWKEENQGVLLKQTLALVQMMRTCGETGQRLLF